MIMPPAFSSSFFAILAALYLLPSAASAQIFADFETSGGNFTMELLHDDQPMAAANFIGLADGSRNWLDFESLEVQRGVPFYDGIKFHRVIKDFMIQGGSPNGRGTDNPGFNFVDRFARDSEGNLVHPHDQQGLLSMANSGINTNGSQFFITDVPTPWLDGKHVVFGKLAAGPFGSREDGIAVITALNDTPVEGSTPVDDLVINSIKIRRIGDAAIAFDINAQGLPILSDPPAQLVVDSAEVTSTSLELQYQKPALSQTDVLQSKDLETWTNLKAQFYFNDDLTKDDISALFEENDTMFFRLLRVDYSESPHQGGPESLAGGTLKLDFEEIFDIDIIIDAEGTDGTWSRPDQGGDGELASAAYTQGAAPYVDRLIVSYEGLVQNSDFVFAMDVSLSFDTATSGRFRTVNNGTPQTLTGTFELELSQ